MSGTLAQLSQRYPGLKVFSDELETRLCLPVASDSLVYQHTSDPIARSASEVIEVVEATFGGKFALPVELTAEHPLAPASGRTVSSSHRPLATIEVWSLEPGSYDLVLRLPAALKAGPMASHMASQFIDHAREITRIVDNLDLLRFQAGPSLSLREAQSRLTQLERASGTRLDLEGLLTIISHAPQRHLN